MPIDLDTLQWPDKCAFGLTFLPCLQASASAAIAARESVEKDLSAAREALKLQLVELQNLREHAVAAELEVSPSEQRHFRWLQTVCFC